jgi:hypothetical protein
LNWLNALTKPALKKAINSRPLDPDNFTEVDFEPAE